MFRIILNITVLFVLLFTTTGYTIFEHYCGGKLVSVSVNSQAEPCCDMEGDCCHNTSEHFQVKEDFISTFTHFNFENDVLTYQSFSFNLLFYADKPYDEYNRHIYITESPPPQKINTLLSQLQAYLL